MNNPKVSMSRDRLESIQSNLFNDIVEEEFDLDISVHNMVPDEQSLGDNEEPDAISEDSLPKIELPVGGPMTFDNNVAIKDLKERFQIETILEKDDESQEGSECSTPTDKLRKSVGKR